MRTNHSLLQTPLRTALWRFFLLALGSLFLSAAACPPGPVHPFDGADDDDDSTSDDDDSTSDDDDEACFPSVEITHGVEDVPNGGRHEIPEATDEDADGGLDFGFLLATDTPIGGRPAIDITSSDNVASIEIRPIAETTLPAGGAGAFGFSVVPEDPSQPVSFTFTVTMPGCEDAFFGATIATAPLPPPTCTPTVRMVYDGIVIDFGTDIDALSMEDEDDDGGVNGLFDLSNEEGESLPLVITLEPVEHIDSAVLEPDLTEPIGPGATSTFGIDVFPSGTGTPRLNLDLTVEGCDEPFGTWTVIVPTSPLIEVRDPGGVLIEPGSTVDVGPIEDESVEDDFMATIEHTLANVGTRSAGTPTASISAVGVTSSSTNFEPGGPLLPGDSTTFTITLFGDAGGPFSVDVVLSFEDPETPDIHLTFEGTVETDNDGDGQTPAQGDCDDDDPAVFLGAPETCNGLDDDCDGALPGIELDADSDSHSPCEGDCDDANNLVFPGATETCDGIDNDCDSLVPETELDLDLDGEAVCEGDCDDADAAANSTTAEDCVDGADNDCDGDAACADSDCLTASDCEITEFDEVEPNDGSPNDLGELDGDLIINGSTLCGDAHYEDPDAFTFTVATGGVWTLSLAWSSSGDFDQVVFDGTGNVVVDFDLGFGPGSETNSGSFNPNEDYFLEVGCWEAPGGGGSYTLTITGP